MHTARKPRTNIRSKAERVQKIKKWLAMLPPDLCKLCKLPSLPASAITYYPPAKPGIIEHPCGHYHSNCYETMAELYRILGADRARAMVAAPSPKPATKPRIAINTLWHALLFYADPARYSGPNARPLPGDPYTAPGAAYRQDVYRDGGHIARAAIESDEVTEAYKAHQVLRAAALVKLMREARVGLASRTAYARVLRALKVLGFEPEEAEPVLCRLEYHDRDGKPYAYLTKKSTRGERR